ncbi:hypothetical protein PR202_ga19951 [Eleusine coracana subsp. coracana]|uniref:NPH3 domain-containing protein n=1 Tax=Eleusine coracana subsp. coracana TaxID=191504 RepID=A0AAV5CXG2_ELECO|nr:hypothetical protein QOZ80_4AG0313550 [Eleusine coracana subsp. coracana]GJN02587.1 hypothetical protein PR202_ga19951 [Eleusine coracana subsp. coracana]
MKLMKLGNRPDIFVTSGNVRYVQAEVPTDLQIQVEDVLFRLHKFPLLSKCLRLQALCLESSSSSSSCIVALDLPDFPGGAEAFDACARFCYGVPVTVGAHNVVPLRCAAARLGMAESGAERGNLAAKLDAFLASCLLRRWKDALGVLRSTAAAGRQYAAACEELGVTSRCVDAVAALVVSAGPTAAQAGPSSSSAWWARDVSDLDVGLFWRVMVAVKATGAVPSSAVGEALRTYARRCLPSVPVNGYYHYSAAEQTDGNAELTTKNHRLLVEKLVSLLPAERHAVSCSFLLMLLKAANILGASPATKTELTRRAAMQLEDATVSDLLIPSSASSPATETVSYDVDAVAAILEEFTLRQAAAAAGDREEEASHARWHGHRRSRSAESATELDGARRSSSASHGAVVRVGRLVDGFLVEAAKDVSLPLEKMVALAEAVPNCARPVHDDLYRAVDTYLRAHPGMDKSARKKLCRVLNCRKLSEAASLHAAQNDLLPLRVVVQVLFFENARAAASNPGTNNNRFADLAGGVKALLTRPRSREVNTDAETKDVQMSLRVGGLGGAPAGDDDWSVEGLKRTASRVTTLRMRLEEEDADNDAFVHRARAGLVRSASSRVRAFCAIPAGKPKRVLSRLWSSGRAVASRS